MISFRSCVTRRITPQIPCCQDTLCLEQGREQYCAALINVYIYIYRYNDMMMHMDVSKIIKNITVSVAPKHTHGIPCLRSRLKQGHASIGSWAIKPSRYRSNGNWAEAMLTSTAKALTRHWQNNSPWSQIHEVHSHMVHYGPIIYYTACIYIYINIYRISFCLRNTPLTSLISSNNMRILSVTQF